jgi:predicted transcriptional regulator
MKTLYLRNVPDEVVARLDRLARREGVSVSAVAIRELADVTRRADNEALLAGLPDTDVDAAELLAALDDGRRRG